MDTPTISICIPVRNGKQFLPQAVESALQQTYQDYEIIIIDNASTDGTTALAEYLALSNQKIRVIKNDRDVGLVGNFNACIQHARGKYLKFLCADDLLMPQCLEVMLGEAVAHQNISIVAVNREFINVDGQRGSSTLTRKKESFLPGNEAINKLIFGSNFIGGPTAVLFPRALATRGFREEFPQLMDMEMWLHLLEKGDLIMLPWTLCSIRRHSGQWTVNNIRSGQLIEDNVRLFGEYQNKDYIRHNWMNHFKHKIHMAYRIWSSRKYLEAGRVNKLIEMYSISRALYILMPVVNLLIRVAAFKGIKWFSKCML